MKMKLNPCFLESYSFWFSHLFMDVRSAVFLGFPKPFLALVLPDYSIAFLPTPLLFLLKYPPSAFPSFATSLSMPMFYRALVRGVQTLRVFLYSEKKISAFSEFGFDTLRLLADGALRA
jgi:hypothetical protein